ncbi:carbohydrate-binding family 9-like protein [Echinicola strongylocentroti]|uniref:Carbohydrate-binding family 9-like protein n=1 Tax=Echinicola strongylocentroti TaxID=1795355 RepID=A0A2Z4IQX9_9BACT|nr:carbohydrate-binding family 9-like protein [Echinicola strongylocentroti]AWW33139.1 carbohydrate-binding family 9-like protein [Echinicola strongylocentroti]
MVRLLYFLLLFPVCLHAQQLKDRNHYVTYRTTGNLVMDGNMDEEDWTAAKWSSLFVDIEGDAQPAPLYDTKLKMLWDEEHLYIGVWMEEPDLWATYTERESVIFHENDIEVFLDPDGDTHNYYELEINALGTEWDLMITKPYRNAGSPINGWNINGLEKGISLDGTVNDPTDKDRSWTVEMAIPWKALSQRGPAYRAPADGEQWRINFSRVQWQLEVDNNQYTKKINPKTGKHFPEYNWVWSPQGHINMHLPEYWGYLQFVEQPVGSEEVPFRLKEDERVKDALRTLYHKQHAFFKENGKFAYQLSELPDVEALERYHPQFEVSPTRFKLSAPSLSSDKTWYITEDSRTWSE